MESGLAGMMAVDTRLMRAATLLDTDPARAALEAAEILKECPGHPGAMLLLGTARLLAEIAAEREDYVEAERLYGLCLKIAPGYSRARRALGDVIQQHPTRE